MDLAVSGPWKRGQNEPKALPAGTDHGDARRAVSKRTVCRTGHSPGGGPQNLRGQKGRFRGGFPYGRVEVRSAKTHAHRRELTLTALESCEKVNGPYVPGEDTQEAAKPFSAVGSTATGSSVKDGT